jgi:hypothetical protein
MAGGKYIKCFSWDNYKKGTTGRPKNRWKDNTKMHLKLGARVWTVCWILVNTAINFGVPKFMRIH